MKKAVVYLNQFFGQIGGEDVADHAPEIREEKVGAAMLYVLGFLKAVDFDIFFAGPAFQAGRYGMACGEIGKAVKEEFDVPVISSMNIEKIFISSRVDTVLQK
jgi:glycine reductase